MQSPINVRPATFADIPQIQRIAAVTWPVAYKTILSDGQLTYMLDLFYSDTALQRAMQEGQNFLLAQKGEKAIPHGFAAAGATDETGAVWKLHKLYVDPSVQGHGVGKTLLNAVENLAASAGAGSLLLNVNRYNPSADFYLHHGYRILQEVDIAIGKGYFMNDFVMARELPSDAE